jgi:hypothetical protein
MSRPKEDKETRLRKAAMAGDELAAFFASEALDRWFEAERKGNIEAMLSCDVGDDDTRRGFALRIQALDKLKGDLKGAIGAAERARKELARIEQGRNK